MSDLLISGTGGSVTLHSPEFGNIEEIISKARVFKTQADEINFKESEINFRKYKYRIPAVSILELNTFLDLIRGNNGKPLTIQALGISYSGVIINDIEATSTTAYCKTTGTDREHYTFSLEILEVPSA